MACRLIARLHAACEIDLLLCGQQGNTPDFLEVHADRVVECNALWHGEVDIDIGVRLVLILQIIGEIRRVILCADIGIVDDLDALIHAALIQRIHCVGGHAVLRERVHQLTAGECPAVRFAFLQQIHDLYRRSRLFRFFS